MKQKNVPAELQDTIGIGSIGCGRRWMRIRSWWFRGSRVTAIARRKRHEASEDAKDCLDKRTAARVAVALDGEPLRYYHPFVHCDYLRCTTPGEHCAPLCGEPRDFWKHRVCRRLRWYLAT